MTRASGFSDEKDFRIGYTCVSSLIAPLEGSSSPRGAIRELRCPSRSWLSSIGFRVIGWRIEELGSEDGY